jgi:hypothetical protein
MPVARKNNSILGYAYVSQIGFSLKPDLPKNLFKEPGIRG